MHHHYVMLYNFYNYIIYHNNEKYLPIDISNWDGDNIDELWEKINLPTLENMDDVNKCIEFYYNKIDRVTKLLNKRTELKNIIESSELLKNEYSLNLMYIDRISDLTIDKILKDISTKYPHILIGNKYNF